MLDLYSMTRTSKNSCITITGVFFSSLINVLDGGSVVGHVQSEVIWSKHKAVLEYGFYVCELILESSQPAPRLFPIVK